MVVRVTPTSPRKARGRHSASLARMRLTSFSSMAVPTLSSWDGSRPGGR